MLGIFRQTFFASINQMVPLKNEQFWAISTIRQDRLGVAQKHHPSTANYAVVIVQSQANNILHLMSKYRNQVLGTPIRRWSQKDKDYVMVTRRKIVEEYNAYIGSVDIMDVTFNLPDPATDNKESHAHIPLPSLGECCKCLVTPPTPYGPTNIP